MPQKTLIFALFAPPEMLRGGTLPFCPPPVHAPDEWAGFQRNINYCPLYLGI